MKNREIKFRAWDNAKKEFFQPTYDASNGKLEELFLQSCGGVCMRTIQGFIHESVFPDRFVFQQFTGLTDKNGKEIYEGDILHKTGKLPMTSEPHIKQNWGQSPRKVVFHDGRFRFVKSKNSKDITAISVTIRQFGLEVVGNIYENPELVKSLAP